MAPPWLPPELGLLVIDHLGAEAELDHDRLGPDAETNINPPFDDQVRLRTLCHCALACRDWLHRSQIHLYKTVQITSPFGLIAFRATLQQNTAVRNYVRRLKVAVDARVRFHEVVLLVRNLLPALHTLQLANWNATGPLPLSNATRPCLAMGFPSVRRVVLYRTSSSRVFHLLRAFPELSELECHEDRDEEDDSSRLLCPSHLSLAGFKVGVPVLPSGLKVLATHALV